MSETRYFGACYWCKEVFIVFDLNQNMRRGADGRQTLILCKKCSGNYDLQAAGLEILEGVV